MIKKLFSLAAAVLICAGVWAVDVTWDFSDLTAQSFTSNKSYSFMATDGTTEMRYSAGSSDAIVAYDTKNKKSGYLKENGTTGSGTVKDIDETTNVGKTRLIRLFVTGKGKLTINCNGTNGAYKVLNGSASGTTLIASLSANTQSAEINATTSPIWIETTTKGYITSIVWSPSVNYTVTYKANGGVGDDIETSASTIAANTFTNEGYKFVVWNTATDGSGTNYAEGASVPGNLTLYAQWAQLYTVTYDANGATGTVPTEDEHIAGEKFNVADQGSIVTPENKAFAGWTYGNGIYAAGAEFTMPASNVEFTAKWVDTYTVTYKANGGTGDDIIANSPAAIAGCTFTAPEGKEFNGWKDGNGTRYEVGAAVSTTLVLFAQWKNAPTTLFAWTKGSGAKIETDNTDLNANNMGSMTVGTSVVARILGTNSIDNNNAGYKLGNDDVCIEIQGTEDFVAGDTVKLLAQGGGDGERGLGIAPITAASSADANVTLTNLINDKNNPRTYTVIVTDKQAGENIRIFRQSAKTMYIKGITVIRPGAKSEVSHEETLTAVTIGGEAIDLNDFSEVETDSFVYFNSNVEYITPPTVVYTKHIEIDYDDDSQTINDEIITPDIIDDPDIPDYFWAVLFTVGDKKYAINFTKKSSYTATYILDGDTIGQQSIDATLSPTQEYIDLRTAKINLWESVKWYTDEELTSEIDPTTYTQADPSNPVNVAFYAKFTYKYATSVNIEQLVLDNGKGEAKSKALLSQLGTLNFASNITYSSGNTELDSLNNAKNIRNYDYLGLKVKASGAMLDFRLAAGKTVKVKYGKVSKTPKVAINGGAKADMTLVDVANGCKTYTYTAEEDTYISISTADGNALVFKQIMIDEDLEEVILPALYTVTYNAGAGECEVVKAETQFSGDVVILPAATREDYTFNGWYTAAEEGELIGVAGAEYTPSADITLYAQYTADEEETGCDWSALSWLGDGSPEQKYSNQFKVCVGDPAPSIVNIQKPGFASETGIYMTFPSAAFTSISLENKDYDVDGAGIIFHLSAFSNKETEVTVVCQGENFVFTVYNDKGIATAIDNTETAVKAQKVLRDGQLYIIYNGKTYNVLGTAVK